MADEGIGSELVNYEQTPPTSFTVTVLKVYKQLLSKPERTTAGEDIALLEHLFIEPFLLMEEVNVAMVMIQSKPEDIGSASSPIFKFESVSSGPFILVWKSQSQEAALLLPTPWRMKDIEELSSILGIFYNIPRDVTEDLIMEITTPAFLSPVNVENYKYQLLSKGQLIFGSFPTEKATLPSPIIEESSKGEPQPDDEHAPEIVVADVLPEVSGPIMQALEQKVEEPQNDLTQKLGEINLTPIRDEILSFMKESFNTIQTQIEASRIVPESQSSSAFHTLTQLKTNTEQYFKQLQDSVNQVFYLVNTLTDTLKREVEANTKARSQMGSDVVEEWRKLREAIIGDKEVLASIARELKNTGSTRSEDGTDQLKRNNTTTKEDSSENGCEQSVSSVVTLREYAKNVSFPNTEPTKVEPTWDGIVEYYNQLLHDIHAKGKAFAIEQFASELKNRFGAVCTTVNRVSNTELEFELSEKGVFAAISFGNAGGHWLILPLPYKSINWVSPVWKQQLRGLYNAGYLGRIKRVNKPALINNVSHGKEAKEQGELEYSR